MKELSIEENAKTYTELINRLEGVKDAIKKQNYGIAMDILCKPYPEHQIITSIELKESEDERIRKAILELVKQSSEVLDRQNQSNMLAWLEKQAKQKSIWHNEDEEPQRGSLILLIMQSGTPIVAKIIEPNHTFNHGERWAYIDDLLEKQGEQKPADKVEPKFKVKYAGNEYNVLDIKENMGITWYGIEDEPNHIDYVKANSCEIINVYGIKENGSPYPTKPAIFAGHNPSDEDMKEALRTEYEKGRADVFAQMHKEWSKEDESIALGIEQIVNCASLLNIAPDKLNKVRDWLKSIKERIGE